MLVGVTTLLWEMVATIAKCRENGAHVVTYACTYCLCIFLDFSWEHSIQDGGTALMLAAETGQVDCARILAERRADVTLQHEVYRNGWWPAINNLVGKDHLTSTWIIHSLKLAYALDNQQNCSSHCLWVWPHRGSEDPCSASVQRSIPH